MAEPVSHPMALQIKSVQRASVILGLTVSVHQYSDEGEQDSYCRCGEGPQACQFVTKLPWGEQACRKSREKACQSSIRRDRPVPFICHMGFSCVSQALRITEDDSLVATFGPFQPAEATGGLEKDVRKGLAALQSSVTEEIPFSLDDIRAVSMEAVPATAEWLRETWHSMTDGEKGVSDQITAQLIPETANTSDSKSGTKGVQSDPFSSKQLLSAVKAHDKAGQRKILENLFRTSLSNAKLSSGDKAHCIAIVSAFIHASEESGFDTLRLRELLPSLQTDLETEQAPSQSINLLLRFFRKMNPSKSSEDVYRELNEILSDHLEIGITLDEVSDRLKCNATTLTKKLQRSFGMSYSEYFGRMRVEESKTLLRTTKLSIGEIGRRVGLRDASNFGKLFRRFEGISPSEFRKQARQMK